MKRVIITWGSAWLWLAMSSALVQKWYEVVCLSRTKPNIPVIHVPVDLLSDESIQQAVATIKNDYATFDVLILNAGGWEIQWFGSFTREAIDNTISLDLTSQIKLVNWLLDTIKANGADIIDIGATIAFKANEHMPVYSMAKWGMRWFVENLRAYLKSTPCRVIAVHPWWMDTESNVGPRGRETIVAQNTWKTLSTMMSTDAIAAFAVSLLDLPKNIEISEAIINKK